MTPARVMRSVIGLGDARRYARNGEQVRAGQRALRAVQLSNAGRLLCVVHGLVKNLKGLGFVLVKRSAGAPIADRPPGQLLTVC